MKLAVNHARVAQWTAPWMFGLSIAFLVCQAVLIVLWVDVPSLADRRDLIPDGETPSRLSTSWLAQTLERGTMMVMAVIWPIIWAEAVYHWIIRPKTRSMRLYHVYTTLFCVLPSLRMCARCPEMAGRLWLPGLQWQRANKRLRRQLSRLFSVPMIGIAMMILPVLVIEFFLKDQVAKYLWLRIMLHVSTGVIWFAFAAEFILMISIADKKVAYIRDNWVDLAIIALPLLSFLRSLQAIRATKLLKFGKLSQLVQAYRLRGTAVKGFRALIVLDVLARFARQDVDRQIAKLETELASHQREARLIRLTIARLRREAAEEESDTDADEERLSGCDSSS